MSKTILLGITGSIAAYKAADIANRLTKDGFQVDVVMTESACKFITPLTLQTLTKRKVHTDMFQEYEPAQVEHISLAKKADLCLLAPATANLIGKLAAGIADDMLSTTVMALSDVPVLICPAMNTNMYENPITQRNMKLLQEFGYSFVEPKASLLACGDVGKGALADVDRIVEAVETILIDHQ